jgi:hypothetical protein
MLELELVLDWGCSWYGHHCSVRGCCLAKKTSQLYLGHSQCNLCAVTRRVQEKIVVDDFSVQLRGIVRAEDLFGRRLGLTNTA